MSIHVKVKGQWTGVEEGGSGTVVTWGSIADKPTTLAGYGITDAVDAEQFADGLADKAALNHNHTVSDITDFPSDLVHDNELSNYVTNSTFTSAINNKAELSHTHTKSQITDFPTKLSEFENDLTEPTLYEGVDLTVKFADEISNFSGDPWAWIKNRINNADWSGLHIGDYIPFTTTTGSGTQYENEAQIAGIDTYYRCDSPTMTGHHIDFISKDCYAARTWTDNGQTYTTVWNETNNNNGTTNDSSPWRSSYLYRLLNNVMFNYLPSNLRSQIVEKRFLVEYRYSSSGTLTDSNTWEWGTIGKLWLPTETEVCGACVWGTKGYSVGTSIQYPIFANRSKIKGQGKNGGRVGWWLLTPRGGSSTFVCFVGSYGDMSGTIAARSGGLGVPLCFRL